VTTVRAVLFDLGHTLVFQAHQPDRQHLYTRIAEQVQPLLRNWATRPNIEAAALIRDLYQAIETAEPGRRERGFEVDCPFIAQGALAAYGVDVSPEQAREFWRTCALDLSVWGWQLYPDTLDTLRRLRTLSMPAAIVSNGWSASDARATLLASFGLSEELAGVFVSSADVGRPKPRPEPFLRALEQLGVTSADAVFVGDDLDADVRGAKALGMTTVWKLNGRHEVPPAPEADYAIHDLWELFTLDLLPERSAAALPQQSLMPHEDDNAGRY